MGFLLRRYQSFSGELLLDHKINVSNNVTYTIQNGHYTTYTTEPASDILPRVISIYFSQRSPNVFPEIEIVFISDPKDITQQHYL